MLPKESNITSIESNHDDWERDKDEKLQFDITRAAAKIFALSSGKIDKYEFLTGEEILSLEQHMIIEKATLTHLLFGKALEN